MKKTVEMPASVQERIADENAIKGRISAVSLEISRLGNIGTLGIKRADAQTRLESFLRGRGENEATITAADRGELLTLKENAAKATEAASTALEADSRLRRELADLYAKLDDITYFASLEDVKKHQACIASAKEEIAVLETAISGQRAVVLENSGPDIDSLYQQRQSLLADRALGRNVDEDLDALNETIGIHEKEREEAAQRRISAEHSITGLNGKLANAKASLEELERTEKDILLHFLMSEAERVGADFVAASNRVQAAYGRLYGLDAIINKLKLKKAILGRYSICPDLPVFNLKAFAGKEVGKNTGLMFSHAYFDRVAACALEEKSITDLGVKL